MTPLSISGAGIRCTRFFARSRLLVASLLAVAIVMGVASPALALSPADFPKQAPAVHVLDEAHVLSRASSQEIERELQTFSDERVDAKVITVAKLDYGLSLEQLGQELLAQWGKAQGDADGEGPTRLLLLIDAQTRSTAVVASKGLTGRLPAELLESTADTTMAIPLRTADRYRQATLMP